MNLAALGDRKEKTVGYYVRTYFPFIFIIECLIANQYANIFFTAGKYGHFSYGSLIWIIYVYPIYYFALTLYSVSCNRKHINSRQIFSVIAHIAIALVSIGVQTTYSQVISLSFGYSVSLLIMILTMETPDYRKLVKTIEELETVRETVDRQDEDNRVFIREMSYEIAEPVAKMIEKSHAIPTDSMNEAQKELCEYVEGYGRLIMSIVNNVMEFNNLNVNVDDYDPVEYSIRDIVKEIGIYLLPLVKDSEDTFKVSVEESVPKVLVGTPMLLRQVMINLISDAVKYTKNGNISLTVQSRHGGQDSINLIINVEDTGVGMKRDMVKQLIRYNTKSRLRKKDAFEGGNFKVRITKKLVEQMNGKLNVDSAVGKGTIFTAIIPQGIGKSI